MTPNPSVEAICASPRTLGPLNMLLYNLSPTPYALSNIALRRLKISRLSDLNDPFELLAADLLNPLHRKAFADWKHELSQSTGLICFSKSWRSPLLWGHYADRHSGIALGFEVPDSLAVDVFYSATRVKIATEAKSDNLVLDQALVNWHSPKSLDTFHSAV